MPEWIDKGLDIVGDGIGIAAILFVGALLLGIASGHVVIKT